MVLLDGTIVGALGLADRLRDETAATVTVLEATIGTRPVPLTGDNQRAAARLADEVGITTVHGALLPADKAALVQELKGAGAEVLLRGSSRCPGVPTGWSMPT